MNVERPEIWIAGPVRPSELVRAGEVWVKQRDSAVVISIGESKVQSSHQWRSRLLRRLLIPHPSQTNISFLIRGIIMLPLEQGSCGQACAKYACEPKSRGAAIAG